MEQDGRMHISVTNERFLYTFAIVIEEVTAADAGRITFVASNEAGTASAAVGLVVCSGENWLAF